MTKAVDDLRANKTDMEQKIAELTKEVRDIETNKKAVETFIEATKGRVHRLARESSSGFCSQENCLGAKKAELTWALIKVATASLTIDRNYKVLDNKASRSLRDLTEYTPAIKSIFLESTDVDEVIKDFIIKSSNSATRHIERKVVKHST